MLSSKRYFPKHTYTPVQNLQVHFLGNLLGRIITVDIYQPQSRKKKPWMPIILFNDGQDLKKMDIKSIWRKLMRTHNIKPCVIVGIHSNANRNQELGTTQFLESNGHGKDSEAYQDFIITQLIPYLKAQWGSESPIWMAGFSLGGLSALDIGLNQPDYFAGIGVFSGALWWRDAPFSPKNPNAHLIIPKKIMALPSPPQLKFWFQTGTLDETNDRDNNGVIDVIDDTLRTIHKLSKINVPQKNIAYLEVVGGKHDYQTWAKAMKNFLIFCCGQD